jgi:NADH dehydrogenase
VQVRTGWKVVGVDEHGVQLEHAGQSERLPTRTVLWAAGVQAASFVRRVAAATGAGTDRAGRLIVGPELTVAGHPEILVVGDAAQISDARGRTVPGVAQGAIQSGKHAARAVLDRLSGKSTPGFRYRDRGDVAIIGRLAGVTNIGWLGRLGRQSGFPAWLLWLTIHIFYLIGFANRLVVIVRWAWSFITHGRGSRLITGQPLVPEIEDPLQEPSAKPVRGPTHASPDGGAQPAGDLDGTPGINARSS